MRVWQAQPFYLKNVNWLWLIFIWAVYSQHGIDF